MGAIERIPGGVVTPNASMSRLRPGEDPRSRYPGDARHWVGVYSELLRLLDEAVLELGGERELSRADLDGYRRLFEERLSSWQRRLREQEEPSLERRERKRTPSPAAE
jgi:hypothetical protein